ncbi:hypothetical protein AH714_08835 [Salmonella enterica]|uniref:hypothetical protein n=1 Tax=Salmonella enterica TaxID=28901 RepID=UPI0016016839|nr:hypothetical protein [Salmonella enterica]EAY0927164.1 hypothetical protein [Salmonella enterica]
MAIYTADPGDGINQPLSNIPSGLGESLLSSLKEGFNEGPVMSGYRFSQAESLASDPNSAIVSKADADAQLQEYGVKSINIPDGGVTQSYLEHVISERRETLAKQQIAMAAPKGWVSTPLNFAASLAGSMADPGNIALALVPFGGEAKAASMLGRFGERFVAGSKMGAAQAIATTPFTAMAAAAEGEDFTFGNALESTFFNTVAGGLMHAGGGVIADKVRSRRTNANSETGSERISSEVDISQPTPVRTAENIPSGINIPKAGTNADLAAAIARDAEDYAYSRAYNDVVPEYLAGQQELQTGKIPNAGELRSEYSANEWRLGELDKSLNQRTTDYQGQRMKFKESRAKAQKDIQAEKDALSTRNEEIRDTLQRNADAEQAYGKETQVSRGEIPDDLSGIISQRAEQIRSGMNMSPVAGAVRTAARAVQEADWSINQQAYRAALAHILDGRPPDIEAFYDLQKPALRERAIERIQNPIVKPDEGGRALSKGAERIFKDTQKPDYEITTAISDLENEFNISDGLLNDIETVDPELAATMRDKLSTIRNEANDESMGKAFKAFASCLINRGM